MERKKYLIINLIIILSITTIPYVSTDFLDNLFGDDNEEEKPVSNEKAMKYLQDFGYVSPGELNNNRGSGGEIFEWVLKEFLGITGKLDVKTKKKMARKRCGMQDVEMITNNRGTSQFKWDKSLIKYSIHNFSPDLSSSRQRDAIRRAFQTWSAVIPIRFEETSGTSDINIIFASGNHGDPWPFDGRGGVLAHATMPKDGKLHFDESENWALGPEDVNKIGTSRYTDLYPVTVHEIGHTLGLPHSKVEDAIMAPFYQETVENGVYIMPRLKSDDIRAIQAIYDEITSTSGSPVKGHQYQSTSQAESLRKTKKRKHEGASTNNNDLIPSTSQIKEPKGAEYSHSEEDEVDLEKIHERDGSITSNTPTVNIMPKDMYCFCKYILDLDEQKTLHLTGRKANVKFNTLLRDVPNVDPSYDLAQLQTCFVQFYRWATLMSEVPMTEAIRKVMDFVQTDHILQRYPEFPKLQSLWSIFINKSDPAQLFAKNDNLRETFKDKTNKNVVKAEEEFKQRKHDVIVACKDFLGKYKNSLFEQQITSIQKKVLKLEREVALDNQVKGRTEKKQKKPRPTAFDLFKKTKKGKYLNLPEEERDRKLLRQFDKLDPGQRNIYETIAKDY
uniref:Peptidase metallopeptidase domain-containing protein n=1 Tax=Meloidogyne javanica TaxID=6303 RepID=A0A915N6T1_MELJA